MIESYLLTFKHQTDAACCFTIRGDTTEIWLPKSQIEVDSDFETLVSDEDLDVQIPDWLAEDKGLL